MAGHVVQELTLDDSSRDRDIPLRVYAPERGERLPLVLFSHGMGEARDSYEYIGRALAESGYVTIHLTHHGSDRELLETKGWLAIVKATRDPENWKNRPRDVASVLDELEKPEGAMREIAARIDPERVAVAGHSAGAYTAMVMAGAIVAGKHSFADRRVKAAVAMSLPRLDPVFVDGAYDHIAIPVLHLTGTRDRSIVYWTFPKDRRVAYDSTPGTNQYLITFRGVNHWTFSNLPSSRDAAAQKRIVEATRLFLEAHLRGDSTALQRLREFDSFSGGDARLEHK